MPGKSDYGSGATAGQGTYFPGSKEYRAWSEGHAYRYSGAALSVPITNNPYSATAKPAEKAAWDHGWTVADAAVAGEKHMPYNTGVAPA